MAYPDCPIGPNGTNTDTTVPPGGSPWVISLRRYIVKIMRARDSPTVTKKTERVTVSKARMGEYSCKAVAKTPPEDDATMSVTTGSNHNGFMRSRE